MRSWIQHLITNEAATADFLSWTEEILSELTTRLTDAVCTERQDEARGLAHEIRVYETIRDRVRNERRERIAQIEYDQKTKGG